MIQLKVIDVSSLAGFFLLNNLHHSECCKISRIGGRQQAAKYSKRASLLVGHQTLLLTTLVLNSIAGDIHSQSIFLKQLKSIKSVALVDKNFHQRGLVQGLLDADVYKYLFLDEKKQYHGLYYLKSIFVWVVTGVFFHVCAYQCWFLSNCSETEPFSFLGSRRDSSSEVDVQRKSSLRGTLQHNDVCCRWLPHKCASPFQDWMAIEEFIKDGLINTGALSSAKSEADFRMIRLSAPQSKVKEVPAPKLQILVANEKRWKALII